MLDTIRLSESDVTRLATSLTNIVNSLPSYSNHPSIRCLKKLLEDFKKSTGQEQVEDFFLLLHLVINLSGNEDHHDKFKLIGENFLAANHIQLGDNSQKYLLDFIKGFGDSWFECDSIDEIFFPEDDSRTALDINDTSAWNQTKKELMQALETAYEQEKVNKETKRQINEADQQIISSKQKHTPVSIARSRRKQLLIRLSLLGIGIALNLIFAFSLLLKCHGVASFLTTSSLVLAGSSAALPLLITALTVAGLGLIFFVVIATSYHRQKTAAHSNTSNLQHDDYQLLEQQELDNKPSASATLEPSCFQTLFPCFYQRKTTIDTTLAKATTSLEQPTQG